MTPIQFSQANTIFGPPPDFDESQVMRIPAFCGKIEGGSCDGAGLVVTAWKPSEDELKRLLEGEPLFLSFIGGLPAHYPCTSFEEATHPA